MLNKIFKSRVALLYILSISMVFSFSAWISLLNNFVIKVAHFNGKQIGFCKALERSMDSWLLVSVDI